LDHIRFNDQSDGEAIAKRAEASYHPSLCSSICRIKNCRRLGGVIYSDFTGESIVMHSASWDQYWINRDMLFCTFEYPFNQLGVKRIFGQVPEDNVHARKFNEKIGFRVVARIEGVFRDNVACLVMCLEREDCRFLQVKPRFIKSNVVGIYANG
jgi:RimJ/RimL family protein N-acetyltransferase